MKKKLTKPQAAIALQLQAALDTGHEYLVLKPARFIPTLAVVGRGHKNEGFTYCGSGGLIIIAPYGSTLDLSQLLSNAGALLSRLCREARGARKQIAHAPREIKESELQPTPYR